MKTSLVLLLVGVILALAVMSFINASAMSVEMLLGLSGSVILLVIAIVWSLVILVFALREEEQRIQQMDKEKEEREKELSKLDSDILSVLALSKPYKEEFMPLTREEFAKKLIANNGVCFMHEKHYCSPARCPILKEYETCFVITKLAWAKGVIKEHQKGNCESIW
jgi:uncharacterized membrane protein YidH (DUF202 family)